MGIKIKSIFKKGLKLLTTHIILIALTFFLLFVLGWLIEKWGFVTFSVITTAIYIGMFYSDGWNWGRIEGKPYSKVQKSTARALAAAIIPSIIPIVLIALIKLNLWQLPVLVAAKLWYFPFIGFFSNPGGITAIEILPFAAIIPVLVTAGYFVGTKNFSLLEKFAYRKNRAKEAAAKEKMNKGR